ncbi:winged helix-turn-helix transcriptional regulator, partial [Bacteroides caecimuris]
RMQEAMREVNLPEPEFHTEGMFTVVFKRQIINSVNYDIVNGRVNDIVNDAINKNEQAILNLLATTPGLNASEIGKHINKSLRTTMRYIKTLQDNDLIEFKGVPKTGGYFLKCTIESN